MRPSTRRLAIGAGPGLFALVVMLAFGPSAEMFAGYCLGVLFSVAFLLLADEVQS